MKISTLKIITIILFGSIFTTSCGEYDKVLKSKDHDLMYRKALEYYQLGKYDRTISIFEEIAPMYMGTFREDTIMFYWGAANYKSGDFGSSEIIFDRFRRQFAHSPFIEEAEYLYAMGFYFSAPEPNRDQTYTERAIISITEYMERYPNNIKMPLCRVRLDELQNKLYDKAFLNARTYYQIGRHKSAVRAFKNALEKYPLTPHREEILYLTTKSSYELASNSIASLQTDRYLDVMDAYYTFISEFPNSQYRKELDKLQKTAKEYLASYEAGAAANN